MASGSAGISFGVTRVRIERDDDERRGLYRRALGLPDPRSGELELGLVRDVTLNSRNDYTVFAETFENVARLTPLASPWVVSTDG